MSSQYAHRMTSGCGRGLRASIWGSIGAILIAAAPLSANGPDRDQEWLPEATLEKQIPRGTDVFNLSLDRVREYSTTKNFRVVAHSYLKGPWRTEFAREHDLGTGLSAIVVSQGIAYLGGADFPVGNTFGILIADVSDPADIEVLSFIPCAAGARCGAYFELNERRRILVVPQDTSSANPLQPREGQSVRAGVSFYDISDPARPRELGFILTRENGDVHGFTIDDQYVYLCANALESKSGQGNNKEVQIISYSDPAAPVLVSRAHLPGQHVGEEYEAGNQQGVDGKQQIVACHDIEIAGDRIYVAYRDAGAVIYDVKDRRRPEIVSRFDYLPPVRGGAIGAAHTAMPIVSTPGTAPSLMVVTDEIGFSLTYDVPNDCPPGFGQIVDISNPATPLALSTLRIPAVTDRYDHESGRFICPETGFHSIHDPLIDNRSHSLLHVTWYDQGLRTVDISNPWMPRETGYYISPKYAIPSQPPQTIGRQTRNAAQDPSTNLIYLTDGNGGGLTVLEWTGPVPSSPPIPGAR